MEGFLKCMQPTPTVCFICQGAAVVRMGLEFGNTVIMDHCVLRVDSGMSISGRLGILPLVTVL